MGVTSVGGFTHVGAKHKTLLMIVEPRPCARLVLKLACARGWPITNRLAEQLPEALLLTLQRPSRSLHNPRNTDLF